MGSATRHRKAFLQRHSICAFCGGNNRSSTIEHCPPRAMFLNREWPEDFEFPACESCNVGTSNHDSIIAMLARMDPFENKGDLDGKHIGLMQNVNRQFPGLFQKMMPSAIEARKNNKKYEIKPSKGQTHQETGLVKIPEEFHQAVCILGSKLAKGIFYNETSKIFPNEGCLLLNWFTNADAIKTKKYPVFEILEVLAGNVPMMTRSNKLLNSQFEYKLSISPEQDVLIVQAKFGNSFGLVIFGSPTPGRLEAHLENLRERQKSEGPFTVLQSTTLKPRY